ncbi:GGDEF domain-containing protein [Marinobacterium sediminicola]|uniref:diguanylate cyclase n=1 Tax=Marinobacterium sediminicola TaxID=518898 RepID=A0ABY1RVW1_9GAMM|nr:sensor domain-containing diguanylate cyclase [Marinobacterium sediminicola]ULG70554.1 GGDEF domain-containing protein [Marinobacterium sediminicola]SMR69032.1 diguanylate cyclase (GGDEF) domain-containing protein [Marinobacterium sediminicola]
MSTDAYEARCQALLNACQDPVFILDNETIVAVSAAEQSWCQSEALVGRSLEELFAKDLLAHFRQVLKQLAEGEDVMELEYQLRPEHLPVLRELGLSEPCWYQSRWVMSEQGEVIWTARDMTAQKHLERKLSHQAQRDPLTGAYNRRTLIPVLEMATAQALRYDGATSILLIDVDDLSGINDRYGWDAGDQVLQQTVMVLHALKRTSDFLARYADDQLVFVLPETNHEQGLLAAERMRAAVENLELPYSTGNLRWTVSIGLASAINLEDDAAALMRRARENLLVAQQSGRNRVEGEAL